METDLVDGSFCLHLGKTFFRVAVQRKVRRQYPRLVIYIPSTSLTFSAFVRASVLGRIFPRAKVFVVGLQARHHGRAAQFLLRFFKPHGLVVLSESMRRKVCTLAHHTFVFTPGVESSRFSPASGSDKSALRQKYHIPQDDYVLLHVGHLKASRNLQVILDASLEISCTLVVVVSSTFEKEIDLSLADALKERNVRIISGNVPIEDLYKLSDCYVFPVSDRTGATEMPLSVLEAMSTNIPIVTTRYGSLPEVFTEERSRGFCFASDAASFAEGIAEMRGLQSVSTRSMLAAFSWESRIGGLFTKMRDAL